MTANERQQFEMLVRVRNFGETNRVLFVSCPAALETFARIGETIDQLTVAARKKTMAAAALRGDRRAVLRVELRRLLRRIARLARNFEAEGRTLLGVDLPRSREDTELLACAVAAVEHIAPCAEDFAGHGLSPARLTAAANALRAAISDQDEGRHNYTLAQCDIRDLLARSNRAAQRLDLILTDDVAHDAAVRAEWKRLRRLEPPRTRGAAALEADPLRVADDQVAVHR